MPQSPRYGLRTSRIVTLSAIVLFLAYLLTSARALPLERSHEAKLDASRQAQRPSDVRKLEVDKPIEREMKGGELHAYEIGLSAGQYLNVVVDQRGIDVVVTVISPDGKQLMEVDSPNGTQGPEPVLLIADASGVYRLNVSSPDKKAASGRYQIRIAGLRAASEDDRVLYEAQRLYDESVRLTEKGKYNEALPPGERALAIREKKLYTEHLDVAAALINVGKINQRKGDYAKAEAQYLRALAIREKVLGPADLDVAAVLNNLAVLYYQDKGETGKAEPLIQRALAIKEKLLGPEHPDVALALNSTAGLYYEKGEYAKAESLLKRALAIWEKTLGLESTDVTKALNNLAGIYLDKGDYARAEPIYQRALSIREKLLGSEHPDVAMVLNNLAELYREKGDYGKAEPLYQRTLAIFQKALGPQHPYVAVVLSNLAGTYKAKGDYDKAEPLLELVLASRATALGPNHPDLATSLNNLAGLYREKGEFAKVEPLYQRALTIREKAYGPEHPSVAQSLNNLAMLYYETGEYAKAEPLFQRALAIREKVLGPDHPNVATTLNNIAVFKEAKGETPQAIQARVRGNNVSERNIALNITAGSERQKLLFLATLLGETNGTISLHVRSAPNDLMACRLGLLTILRRKGRALDAMTDSIGALRRRLNQQDRTLLDQLTDTRSRLATLVLKGPGRTDPAQHRAQIKRLEEQVERLEAEISSRSAEFRAQSQSVTLEAVQAAIPRDAALVEFVSYRPVNLKYTKREERFAEPHYMAYVLRNQGEPSWVELGEGRKIDSRIEALRRALRDPKRAGVKQLARAVDEEVMQPVRKLIGRTPRVLLSPDGALNLVPFAALVDENNQHLVKRYSFTYLTSGRDLLRLQARVESRRAAMIVADPDFGEEASAGPIRKLKITTSAIDFSDVYFSPLPGTAEEAQALKAIIPSVTVLTKGRATEAALKQAEGPSILHVATHGFFLEDVVIGSATGSRSLFVSGAQAVPSETRIENPLLRSGLGLAGANLHKSGGDDGVLTALEAAGLDLWGTKLVVLSACDTGVGEVKNGDGVYGLRRALVLAGSESQVMSLWPVSDTATRDLMIDYYKGLQSGEGRGEGLRQVQLKMLASKNRQHPYYWASFIQSGEWANLDGKR